MTRGLVRALALTVLLSCCGESDSPEAPAADSGADTGGPDVALARKLLATTEPLPHRAEVVAVTDRLAIDSAKAGRTATGAQLAYLAAQLRERVWRHDRKPTDAREALELYAAVVEAGAGSALSCDADLRRALLVGEASRDASQGFRALYLANRRQRAAGKEVGLPARKACLNRIQHLLDLQAPYRPTGDAWAELERLGDTAAFDHEQLVVGPTLTAAPATASAQAPANVLLSPDQRNIVVAPDDSQLSDQPVELRKVQPFSWEQGGRVVLTLSGPTTYKLGTLGPDVDAGRGHRVYLDVARTRIKGVRRRIESKGLVGGVRLARRQGGVRVVVDLERSAYQKVFYLPQPFRIVMDLSTRAPARAGKTVKGGKRDVRRVSLDPGHGGDDSGAVGPTGLREKDVTLDIAHRAAPALAHELGVETMLTRDTDVYVYLEERIARANAFHADLFVSIHCNATEDGNARGVQLFVLDPSREIDAVARRVAIRENAALDKRGRPYDPAQVDAQIAAVAAGLNVGDLAQRSGRFAELLRSAAFGSMAKRYGRVPDHGIRTAGFFVLLGAEMPAVLYETAFISNPDDESLLGTADFRQKHADAIVNAVRAYREGR